MDEMSSGDESEEKPMPMDILEDIYVRSQSHRA